jgi:hypothetical protein
MIDVDALVQTTLETLGVPARRLTYKGDAGTYITWQRILGEDAAFADDGAEAKEHSYRADIFSKSDYAALIVGTEKALKTSGFYGVSDGPETYEKDTAFFHMPISFSYMSYEDMEA